MKEEWRSHIQSDGREVVVRRRGEHWLVRCGRSLAHSKNLDVALASAVRAETEVVARPPEVHYPNWIRGRTGALDPANEPLARDPGAKTRAATKGRHLSR